MGRKQGHPQVRIPVAIHMLKHLTIVFADSRDQPFGCGDVECSIGLRCHPAHMDPWIVEVCGNNGSNDVTSTKTVCELLRFGSGSREAMFIHQAHLPTATPVRFDEERHHSLDPNCQRDALPYTGRIPPAPL